MVRDLEIARIVQEDGAARLRFYGWRRPTLSLGYGQKDGPGACGRSGSISCDAPPAGGSYSTKTRVGVAVSGTADDGEPPFLTTNACGHR